MAAGQTSKPVPDSDGADISTSRVEAFSDGVLSIAITLLVLDLHFSGPGGITASLAKSWPAWAAYVISFLIIGVVWMNHHTMFHYIRRVDRMVLIYNLLMLMCVSFLPWAAALLADSLQTGEGQRAAAITYGLTLAAGGVFFNAIWFHVSANHRHLADHISPAQAMLMRKQFAVGPCLYVAAAAIGAFSAVASLAVYAALLVAYMFEAGASSRKTSHADTAGAD